MSLTLMPQQVYLLCARWSRPTHLPELVDISDEQLREYYINALTDTMADWLAMGLLAWQSPLRRQYAFVPVEWAIGTKREHDTHLDALAFLGQELHRHEDPFFPVAYEHVLEEFGGIKLGAAYADAAAVAVAQLAQETASVTNGRQDALNALCDALELTRRLEPGRLADSLLKAWQLVFDADGSFRGLTRYGEKKELGLKHAFIRAMFQVLHAGNNLEIMDAVLCDFGRTIEHTGSLVLDNDLEQCRTMIDLTNSTCALPAGSGQPLVPGMPANWAGVLRPRTLENA